MVHELITLPLRVAGFTTRVGVHLAVNALGAGFTVTERLVEVAVPRPEQYVGQRSSVSVAVLAVPADDPSDEPPAESASEPAVPEESLPDAGAQNGAGASTQESEPWAGYAGMNAHEVIHRLTGATADEAAAVELYERGHGKRKTVLAAAERRLRQPAGAVGQRSSLSVAVLAVPADDPSDEPPAESASEPAVPEESLPDAGAQNGAGASTQESEPWAGYAGMNAHEVIHRLTGATADEAAAVELYERGHGKRKTVLAAAERRLRQPAGAGRS